MKVLSISHLFPNSVNPDVGIFVKERLKFLAEKVDLTVLAPVPFFPFMPIGGRYGEWKKLPGKEVFDTLNVCHPRYFSIPRLLKPCDGFFYYTSLNRFVCDHCHSSDIDILDFHWVYPDAFAGLKWARRHGKKIVVTIRGNESIRYFEKNLSKKLLVQTLRHVDHVIAVSSDMKHKVTRDYGLDPAGVTVVPNGIDEEVFYPLDQQKARRHCGLSPEGKYILSLSRLSSEKGLNHLIEAFSLLAPSHAGLLIVGDGPWKKTLVNQAKASKVSDRILFIDAVPHKEAVYWYNAADVFCLPSLWEGCPNTVIESLACGTPVVATNVGGIPDLLPEAAYGLLVNPADARQLAEALGSALGRKWDNGAIAQFGRRNTWRQVADRVVAVFQMVLQEKTGANGRG